MPRLLVIPHYRESRYQRVGQKVSTPESYLETPQSEHVTALDTFARRAPRISQADVFQAADALLVEGHRPTIDRVRMRLGRGSPNTINDHLDAWWSKLGARLRDLPGKEFPQLPERVAHSLQQLWNEALAGAHEALQAGLLEREHSLDQRASALQQASRQLAEREQAATARAIGLEESLALVRDQLAAANQRAQALEKNLEERDRECARLRRRVETLEVSATEARAKFDAAAAAHQAERAQLQGRHEAAEGHWQREVDRARQLAKEAAKDHERQCTDFRDQIGTLQTDRGQLRQELREVRSDLKTALIVREQLEARRLAIRSPPKRMSRAADRPAKRPRTPKGGSKIKVRERARGQGALRQPMIKCEILEPVRAI